MISVIPTYNICGIPIATYSPTEAAECVVSAAHAHRSLAVHLCNSYTFVTFGKSQRVRDCIRPFDLNLPDGVPVAILGRKAGVTQPVRGPRLFRDTVAKTSGTGITHGLYGGMIGVASSVAGVLSREYNVPAIALQDAPFGPITDDEIGQVAAAVKRLRIDILWVGLGTPKQDIFVTELACRVSVPVVAVGAAFDFVAGTVAEAPSYLHGSGLEWIYRLFREPRRLWRRYLFGNAYFLGMVIRDRRSHKGS